MKVLTRRSKQGAVAQSLGGTVAAIPTLREAISIATGERRPLESFRGTRVHAVAGIGNPQAYFDALTALGVNVDPHPLPDHARLSVGNLAFPDGAPVLMTEKDAVKCAAASRGHPNALWAVRMDIAMSAADARVMQQLLDRVLTSAG